MRERKTESEECVCVPPRNEYQTLFKFLTLDFLLFLNNMSTSGSFYGFVTVVLHSWKTWPQRKTGERLPVLFFSYFGFTQKNDKSLECGYFLEYSWRQCCVDQYTITLAHWGILKWHGIWTMLLISYWWLTLDTNDSKVSRMCWHLFSLLVIYYFFTTLVLW